MSYIIGQNCEAILDGTGYYIRPGTFHQKWPRVRKATVRADNSEAYVDLGPGKRTWIFTVLCMNDLVDYGGVLTGTTGQQYRDALRTSYTGSVGTTINFTDPLGVTTAVHFDSYSELVHDLHIQQVALASGIAGLSYDAAIELVEA